MRNAILTLAAVSVAGAVTTLRAEDISTCGRLVEGVECTLFLADDGETYALEHFDGFEVGAEVWVAGELLPECVTFCSPTGGCLTNHTIAACFDGCGTLVIGPQGCPGIELDVAVLVLENTAHFTPGANIRVRGCLNPESGLCAPLTLPGIEGNSIRSCCPEDIDGDGFTGLNDLAALLAIFGAQVGDANFDMDIDFDDNGQIGLGDLAFMLASYGLRCGFTP